jgi:hypothetical protein
MSRGMMRGLGGNPIKEQLRPGMYVFSAAIVFSMTMGTILFMGTVCGKNGAPQYIKMKEAIKKILLCLEEKRVYPYLTGGCRKGRAKNAIRKSMVIPAELSGLFSPERFSIKERLHRRSASAKCYCQVKPFISMGGTCSGKSGKASRSPCHSCRGLI